MPSASDDFERILALRLVALRQSLERLGRYDPVRARDRLAREFQPEHMRLIEVDGAFAGCVSLKPDGEDGLAMEHFYIDPAFQNLGLGGAVMGMLLAEADAAGKPVRLGVLKRSDANRFYQRHGFELQHTSEWDAHYVRPAAGDRDDGPY